MNETFLMTYKLYYDHISAAEGVRVVLEEIGLPYELVVSFKDRSRPRLAQQLVINLNGWIPVLSWDETGMYECEAIIIFLCDKYPKAQLAPLPNALKRSLYLQTLVYFSNSVQTAFQTFYYPDRFVDMSSDEASAQRRGIRRLRETLNVIDQQIGGRDWLLGEHFSAADIYFFMLTTWLQPSLGHPSTDEFPNVKRIVEASIKRPSIRYVYSVWMPNLVANQTNAYTSSQKARYDDD